MKYAHSRNGDTVQHVTVIACDQDNLANSGLLKGGGESGLGENSVLL